MVYRQEFHPSVVKKGSAKDIMLIAACLLFLAVTISIVIISPQPLSFIFELIFLIPQYIFGGWLLERFASRFSRLSSTHNGFSLIRILKGSVAGSLLFMLFLALMGIDVLGLIRSLTGI